MDLMLRRFSEKFFHSIHFYNISTARQETPQARTNARGAHVCDSRKERYQLNPSRHCHLREGEPPRGGVAEKVR